MRFRADFPVWTEMWLSLLLGVAIIISLAAVGARLASRKTAVWQRTIWQVCVLSLVALILGELTGVTSGIIQISRNALASGSMQRSSLPTLYGRPRDEGWPEIRSAGTDVNGDDAKTAAEWTIPSLAMEEISVNGDWVLSAPRAVSGGPFAFFFWLGIAWLVGTLAILLRTMFGQIALVVFRWQHGSLDDKPFMDRLHVLARKLGLGRVRVLAADGLAGPIAFGCFWPTIGLPRRFVGQFAVEEREAILAHELGHLAARDPAWHLLADLVTAVLWWHPLAWWARHQLRMASEYAADEACLVVRDGPGALAACLVDLGRRLTMPPVQAWLRIEGNAMRSSLARRVTRLLVVAGQSWQPPARVPFLLVKGIGPTAMVAAALLCTAWSRPLVEQKGKSMTRIIQQSWRQSLAAIALVSVLGSAEAPALADDVKEQETIKEKETVKDKGTVKEEKITAGEKLIDKGYAVKKVPELPEGSEIKQRLANLEREIEELRKVGKPEAAEKLSQHYKELVGNYYKDLAASQNQVKDPKPVKSWEKTETGNDELRARLKELEIENAQLRELVGKVAPQAVLKEFKEFDVLKAKAIKELPDLPAAEYKALAEKIIRTREFPRAVEPKSGKQPLEEYRPSATAYEEVINAIKQIQGQLNGLQKEVAELRSVVRKGDDKVNFRQ